MKDLQKTGELQDDLVHQVRELTQKWKDMLTLYNPRLVERYIKVQVEIHVHFRVNNALNAPKFCAVAKRHEINAESEGGGLRRTVAQSEIGIRATVSNNV